MKGATRFLVASISALLVASAAVAQQAPPRVRAQAVPPRISTQPSATQASHTEPRRDRSPQTYQVVGFTFWTGSDDLRGNTPVSATLTFPDGTTQKCELHGDATSWDNNSRHDATPCHLQSHARTLTELKRSRMEIQSGLVLDNAIDTADNWNINRVVVQAYNSGSPSRGACVFSVAGTPLVRLTGTQSSVTISDFPSHC